MILVDEQTTSEYVAELPLGRCRPHPHNPRGLERHDDPALHDLAASIQAQGVIHPIIVVPDPDDNTLDGTTGSYLIVAGHRRWRASERAGETTIPALIRHDLTDPAQIETWMLIENGQRADLDPIDEATMIRRITVAHGVPQRALAERMGRSQSHLSKRLALLKLGFGVQQLVRARVLPVELGAAVAGLPGDMRGRVTEAARAGKPGERVHALAVRLVEEARAKKRSASPPADEPAGPTCTSEVTAGHDPASADPTLAERDLEFKIIAAAIRWRQTPNQLTVDLLIDAVDDYIDHPGELDDDVADLPGVVDTADPTMPPEQPPWDWDDDDAVPAGPTDAADAGPGRISGDDYELATTEPWANYDRSAANPARVAARTNDPAKLRHMLIYEQAHRARADVIDAATARLDLLDRADA